MLDLCSRKVGPSARALLRFTHAKQVCSVLSQKEKKKQGLIFPFLCILVLQLVPTITCLDQDEQYRQQFLL